MDVAEGPAPRGPGPEPFSLLTGKTDHEGRRSHVPHWRWGRPAPPTEANSLSVSMSTHLGLLVLFKEPEDQTF